MSTEEEGGLFSCPTMCWIIGALLGVATYLILTGRFMMGATVSLGIAVVFFATVGYLLGRLFCHSPVSTHGHPARHDHDIAATRASVVSADSSGAMVSGVPDVVEKTTSNGAAAASKATETAKSKTKSASAAGTGAKKAAAKPAVKAKAAAKPAAKAKPASKPAAKTKPATATKPTAKTAPKPARAPVAKDGKPEMLKKARASGADDLKQIKGVGPKLETMMNKMGIYHFDQVSGWRAKEVKWADENIKGVKGRVSRDEWVKQAKILAKGGQTAFSKKVAKGDVYASNKK